MRTLLLLCSALLLSTGATAQNLIIDNVTLIDGTGAPSRSGMTVTVTDGRFAKIEPKQAGKPIRGRRIDGTGKYLIPGFIDTHVHLLDVGEDRSSRERKAVAGLASFLLAGVTTIYDAGNEPDVLLKLRTAERLGKLDSPRLYSTGSHVTAAEGQGSGEAGAVVLRNDVGSGAKFERYLRDQKPDLVKLLHEEGGWGPMPKITTFTPAGLKATIGAAHRRGVRTTVHISTEQSAREALVAGADSLAHPVITQPITDRFIKLLATNRVPVATTMAVGDFRARVVDSPLFLNEPLYVAAVSAEDLSKWRKEGETTWRTSRWTEWRRQTVRLIQANLARMHAGGVILSLGSDMGLGGFTHREMELLQDAGLSPIDIITIATLNGAKFLGEERDLGSIEIGKQADAILLSGDPTNDIRNARKIVTVLKGGKVINRSSLPLAGDKAQIESLVSSR